MELAFKAAVRLGKICYVGGNKETYCDIAEVGLLTINQWKTLERNERCLRNHLSSKKYNVGDFTCNGDFKLWVKVFNILNGIFLNNHFLLVKKNNQQWSTQFLKFAIRILSTLPIDSST